MLSPSGRKTALKPFILRKYPDEICRKNTCFTFQFALPPVKLLRRLRDDCDPVTNRKRQVAGQYGTEIADGFTHHSAGDRKPATICGTTKMKGRFISSTVLNHGDFFPKGVTVLRFIWLVMFEEVYPPNFLRFYMKCFHFTLILRQSLYTDKIKS